MFRKLKANEIDVRVQSVSKAGNKARLLLYKDARCDMNILDETVGPMNWQRYHSRDNANCTVSIYDDSKGLWVSKEDTGTESNTEKEKGLASDSFKRACFNWGIGRELYTAPKNLWVNVKDKDDAKYATFVCDEIDYDINGDINRLVISRDGKAVYNLGNKTNQKEDEKTDKEYQNLIKLLMNDQVTTLGNNESVYNALGMTEERFKNGYKTFPKNLYEHMQKTLC